MRMGHRCGSGYGGRGAGVHRGGVRAPCVLHNCVCARILLGGKGGERNKVQGWYREAKNEGKVAWGLKVCKEG
jgi:hypothetical protein